MISLICLFFSHSRLKSEVNLILLLSLNPHKEIIIHSLSFSYQIPRNRLLAPLQMEPQLIFNQTTPQVSGQAGLWGGTVIQWPSGKPSFGHVVKGRSERSPTILNRSVGGPVRGSAVQIHNGCWRVWSKIMEHPWSPCPWGEHEEADEYHWDQQAAPLLPLSCHHTCVHSNHPPNPAFKAEKKTRRRKPQSRGRGLIA